LRERGGGLLADVFRKHREEHLIDSLSLDLSKRAEDALALESGSLR
jgi:hypothetical protein